METDAIGITLEERLATLSEYGAEILKRWAITADRHAAAVSQFESHLRELSAAGSQLHEDTSQRLQDLERIIQQEWDALRQLHEAPIKSLVEQAASLTEVCLATANSAQSGFDRAEARLVALETEFQRTTSELTREIRGLMAELRNVGATGRPQLPGQAAATPAWPLEGVTRLHNQLRETDAPQMRPIRSLPEGSPSEGRYEEPPAPRGAETPRVGEAHRGAEPRRERLIAAAMAAVVVLVVAGGAFAWRIERDVRTSADRVSESQRQMRVATDSAVRAAAEKQQEAARELAAAQQLATRAQRIGNVLAAPDLVRFPLVGREPAAAATGQMLWSRSRGFVFSASALPVLPTNATYQLWLLTRTGAISAGTFSPDSGGGATVSDVPKSPPPLAGAMVTMEPKGGSLSPSGAPLLARIPASPAP